MAKDNENPSRGISRREFIKTAGSAGGVLTLGPRAVPGGTGFGVQPSAGASGPYNIVFILTDQERYFDPATLPEGYSLPGRERLEREGVTFTNHQIASSVCSSSRSVIYTGQHTGWCRPTRASVPITTKPMPSLRPHNSANSCFKPPAISEAA